ncbi:MFS transporter [Caulobacter sp. FWC2]|uniref:MFS transporter n=1 Tax=Caulobacter sp. FWC2 TaxID=69664 RepID=UPI000C152013|nr:MFS transporter [Caulobacter sp. FWC2]PIB93268.1 hypothetical protein CSW62_17760 [Caulobacter sp. FWC2]
MTILGLFVLAMVLNYLSRSVPGVAAPMVLSEQSISSEQYSWITSAFQLGVMFQPLVGYFLDGVGLRLGFALCAILWSLITMAHIFAQGWVPFAGLRLALGLTEGSAQTPWMAYLCGRPLPGRQRCVLGRETALQPMRWCEDGWLRSLTVGGALDPAPAAPGLPPAPWPQQAWDGGFAVDALPTEFQWLRTPYPDELFSLAARPGYLRLYGRETIGSPFRQALVARRQEDLRFTATTRLEFAPVDFQQAAGLVCYYNSTKFHYLHVSREGSERQLQLMTASPDAGGCTLQVLVESLPEGPIDLRVEVDLEQLRFAWRGDRENDWRDLPDELDASILSDEASLPGLPNFTGTFVGMACQDMSGRATPADFAFFRYEGRGDD